MKTVSKEQALALAQESLWGWKQGDFDDCENTPKESRRFADWVQHYYEQEYHLRTEAPIEVPCGWLIRIRPRPDEHWIGFSSAMVVNLWTGEVFGLGSAEFGAFGLGAIEARIRWYIDKLPAEQRTAALSRMHLLPYAPVRFYPPWLVTDSVADQGRQQNPLNFSVEFDTAYFSEHGISLPTVTLREFYEEADGKRGFYSILRPEALTRITESVTQENVVQSFQLMLPPLLSGYARRNAICQVGLEFSEDVASASEKLTMAASHCLTTYS